MGHVIALETTQTVGQVDSVAMSHMNCILQVKRKLVISACNSNTIITVIIIYVGGLTEDHEGASSADLSASSQLRDLPSGLIQLVEAVGDRLVSKASQLIQHETTNLSESFMSVRSKLDGGKFYNRIQSGSFQHRCAAAAALRLQHGPGWVAELWKRRFGQPTVIQLQFAQSRKRKLELDCARKVTEKYKRRSFEAKRTGGAQQDTAYAVDAVQPEVLKSLCEDYLSRLQVTRNEATAIAERTTLQADDSTGEWSTQRRGRLTASKFGEVAKRRAAYASLTIRQIYGRMRDTPSLRYGRQHESDAHSAYEEHLKSRHLGAKVDITGVHIDTTHCWLAASHDGLVFDPLATSPEALLEIKCPFSTKDTPLVDICTDPKKKSHFFMNYNQQTRQLSLKRQHPYYYQVQGQMQITGRKWCDFYVWTPQPDDRVVERASKPTSSIKTVS